MKNALFAVGFSAFVMVANSQADTLHLRSGQAIGGNFLGATASQIKFEGFDGQLKTYPLAAVEAVEFSVPPPPPPPPPPRAKPASVTVLAGTNIMVRMVDSLSTKSTTTGQLFTATLDSSLVANGVVVARRGTTVHGRVAKSENARRLTGKSEMQLELIDIVINGVAQPIQTNGFQEKGKSEGAQTAKKVAGGAGLGAIVGGISGNAGKGAAIGATAGLGVAMVKKGQPIEFPSETLLQFSIAQPTTLPVAH